MSFPHAWKVGSRELCAESRERRLVAENALLLARVAELEARLGLPPKTPDNSSTPPSQGRKASDDAASKPKCKPHAGAHRPLHPNPTARRDMMAAACQHCGADVSGVPQIVCEAYTPFEAFARFIDASRPVKAMIPPSSDDASSSRFGVSVPSSF
jgi:transposase